MASQIAEHYNAIPNCDRKQREKSPIIRLKNANNFVKKQLLRRFCVGSSNSTASAVVGDFCCGKLTELFKYAEMGGVKEVHGVDISPVAIKNGKDRHKKYCEEVQHQSGNRKPIAANFYVADCHSIPIEEILSSQSSSMQLPWFDTTVCMFALHYAFETESRAHGMLRNISARLLQGGTFICTIPDARVIDERLTIETNKIKRLATSTVVPITESKSATIAPVFKQAMKFGNSIYSVDFTKIFEKDCKEATTLPVINVEKPFGIRYNFTLHGAVDCHEYLVHLPALIKLAAQYGLQLVDGAPFTFKQVEQWSSTPSTSSKALSADEMEVFTLYTALIFVKV